ncbi:MAG: exo-alpha-sialidase [Acidimicrobiia bacterium]|nr:exo-alpha-sialidase [Acidimicrobiia bacterium]
MVSKDQIERRFTRANPVANPEHLHGDPAEADALLSLILERRDDMTTTRTPLPTRPPVRPRWQPARIAAVTAVLVVLVVGVAALIGFTGSEPDTADPGTTLPASESTIPEGGSTLPPVTDPPPTTLPPPTEQPAAATLFDGSWTHETSEQPFARFEVVTTSLGYFSVGTNRPGSDGGTGVWFSADGTDWEQVLTMPVGEVIGDAELLPDEPPQYTIEASVRAIVEFDGEVYAFAVIVEDAHSPSESVRQVAYRTTNGFEFDEVTIPEEVGISTVLAGSNEMIVLPHTGSIGNAPTPVLRSEDGTTWTRHETGLTITEAAFVDGVYLAVGEFEDSEYEWGRRTMVESADGIEWTEIREATFADNEFPRFLTPFGDLHYMGGLYYDESGSPAQTGVVFYSDDGGASWQRATMPAIPDLAFVNDLIPTEHGLLAVGWAGWSEEPARVVPMAMVDGTTFVELPTPDSLFNAQSGGYSGYREGEAIVVFGNDYDPVLFHKWTWTPND